MCYNVGRIKESSKSRWNWFKWDTDETKWDAMYDAFETPCSTHQENNVCDTIDTI